MREFVVSVVLRDEATRPLQNVYRATDRIRAAFSRFGTQSSKANEQVSESARKMERVYRDANGRLRDELGRFVSESQRAGKAVRSFQSSVERASGSVGRFSNNADHAVSSLKSMAVHALGAVSAYQALGRAVKEAAQFEQSKVLIEAMFNNQKAANEYMQMLQRVAVDSPVLNSQDMFANSKSFISLTKDVKTLERAWKVVEKLNVMDPAQGVEGAVLAMRELASGDVVSMVERFEMPRSAVKAIKDLPFEQQVKALDQLLSKMNITDKVVQKMGDTTLSQWNRFKEMTSIAFRDAGKSANSELGGALRKINDLLEKGALNNFVRSVDSWLGRTIDRIIGFGLAAKRYIQPAAQFFRENASSIKAVASALGAMMIVGKVTGLLKGLFSVVRMNPVVLLVTGAALLLDKLFGMDKVIDTVKNAFKGLYDIFMSLFYDTGEVGDILTKMGFSPQTAAKMDAVLQQVRDGFDVVKQAVRDFVVKVVIPLMPQAQEMIESAFKLAKPAIGFVVDLFGAAIEVIKTFVQKVVVPSFPTVKDIISTTFNIITPILKIAARAFQAVSTVVMFLIKNVVIPLIPKIVPSIQSMWKVVGPILKALAKLFQGVSDAIEWAISMFGRFVKAAKKIPQEVARIINNVVDGINWVLGKIGVKTRIPKWEPPKYAKGTRHHPGGFAIVGDGGGPELIRTPSGQVGLSPNRSTLTYLPKGTEVLPHEKTKMLLNSEIIPAYKDGAGDGLLHRAWEAAKGVVGQAKDIAIDVWSLITRPSQLMKKVWEQFGVSTQTMSGGLGELIKGALSLIKGKASDFVKRKLNSFLSFGSGVPNSVSNWVRAAMAITGVPASWFRPLITIAMKESGGNPRAINLWDVNAKRGTPSKGLFQTIDPTFNRYKLPGMNDIWNPIHNAVAAIRYMIARYGSVFNVPGIRNMMKGKGYVGYREGGVATEPQIAALAESGWKEYIIPTEPRLRNRARSLLSQANTELGYNSNQRPSVVFSPRVDIHVTAADVQSAGNLETAINRKLEEMWQMFLDIYATEVVR
ncbi:transglycosylase SLT domain-containing protein [Geobacillus sp. CCR]